MQQIPMFESATTEFVEVLPDHVIDGNNPLHVGWLTD